MASPLFVLANMSVAQANKINKVSQCGNTVLLEKSRLFIECARCYRRVFLELTYHQTLALLE